MTNPKVNRSERFTSHALAEIRKWKFWPFGVKSAILLDLSHDGFKLEFTSAVKARSGDRYWLTIPMAPLGVTSPKRIVCPIECRWFDRERYRMGGVFFDLDESDQLLIKNIISHLRTIDKTRKAFGR